MSHRNHPLAVQIQHSGAHATSGHSGALGLSIMFVGVALVCYGVGPTVMFRLWRAQALCAPGLVVDNIPKPSGKGIPAWLPLVEFEADGTTIMSLIPGPSSRQSWPLGGAVDVLYDPADPHRARLADTTFPISSYLIAGLAIIGIFLAVVA
jgi:hypothetical protein